MRLSGPAGASRINLASNIIGAGAFCLAALEIDPSLAHILSNMLSALFSQASLHQMQQIGLLLQWQMLDRFDNLIEFGLWVHGGNLGQILARRRLWRCIVAVH